MNGSGARSRRPGQPLQFLALVLGGWVTARAGLVLLPLTWQSAAAPTRPGFVAADPPIAPAVRSVLAEAAPMVLPIRVTPTVGGIAQALPVRGHGGWSAASLDELLGLSAAFRRQRGGLSGLEAAAREPGQAEEAGHGGPVWLPGGASGDRARDASRWSLVGWMLWRPDGGASLGQGPLLGGSQAGLRLDYALGGGLALYGRATRAFERPFAEEGAVGLSFRPDRRLPMALMVERRQRLGTGGRSGFALLAAGGVGPQPLAGRVEIEGYAQGGIVGLPGADGFADGRLSLDYRLSPPARRPAVSLGATLSGSAQPGATRLDLGPGLRLRLPAGHGALRLSAEWRTRISGDARPARGPAITLVADF